MKIEKTKTRVIGKFTDLLNERCSIESFRLSSGQDAICLGIDNPKITVYEDRGLGDYVVVECPEGWSVNGRMYLSKDQVAELLPFLQKFVEK